MKSHSAFKNIFVVFAFLLLAGWGEAAAEDEGVALPEIQYGDHVVGITYQSLNYLPVSIGGPITRFTLTPALQIPGLIFDSVTGGIRGIPLEATSYFTEYEITVEGPGGSYSAPLYLYVYEGVFIQYSPPTAYTIGVPIDTLRPTLKGLPAAGWNIYPNLTAATGLIFSPETGDITGTPTKLSDSTLYIIQGYSADDLTGTAEIWISVREAPVVNAPPEITIQPRDTTVVSGSPAMFSAAATAIGEITYQWKKGGVDIVGATGATITVPTASIVDTGSYSVIVTSTLNGTTAYVTSSSARLSVNVAPIIVAHPLDQTVVSDSSAWFSVSASGLGSLSYQWTKGGVNVPGATSAVYSLSSVSIADTGLYSVIVTSTLNGTTTSVASNPARLSVNQAPVVFSQPRDTTVVSGSSASFSVQASGLGVISYQWTKGGVNVVGATSSTYTLPTVSIADTGAYSVVVTCTLNGTITLTTSASAHLSVNVAPVIAIQPLDQTVVSGDPLSFSVSASGLGALSYQWKKSGVILLGATSSTYTMPTVSITDTGLYTVAVTSTLNGTTTSITSNPVRLSVNQVPVITSQPRETTVVSGSSASFSVQASGLGVISFQWKRAGVNIVGATSAAYSLTSVSIADTGLYSVVVTSTLNGTTTSTTSSSVHLSVNVAPVIAIQPLDRTVVLGSPVTFSISASGLGVLSYQWAKGGVNIVAATSAILTLPTVSITDTGSYSVVVTSTLNGTTISVTSSSARLSVNQAPVISAQPRDTTVVSGSLISLSVSASGLGALSYQWKKGGVNIVGAISLTYILPVVSIADTGSYSVVVTSSLNGTTTSITSNLARLSINQLPVITSQPRDTTVVAGSTASFAVLATGSGSLSYQWKKGGTTLPGATSAVYSLTSASIADTGSYMVAVTSTLNGTTTSITSNPARLSVNQVPVITSQPRDTTVVSGSLASFSVSASGQGNLTYQWRKDGIDIPGATEAILNRAAVSLADTGSFAVAVTSNLNGILVTTSSNAGSLRVNVAPIIVAQPTASQIILVDGTATLTVVVAPGTGTSAGTLSYQWHKNGTVLTASPAITGVSSPSLAFTSLQASDSGSYSIVVTRTLNGTITTTTSTTSVLSAPVAILPNAFVIKVNGREEPYAFQIPAGTTSDQVTLSIMDTWGRTVWFRSFIPARDKATEIAWTGRTSAGRLAGAGMYVVRVSVREGGKMTNHLRREVTLKPR